MYSLSMTNYFFILEEILGLKKKNKHVSKYHLHRKMSWQIQIPDHAARKFSSEVITTKLITLNKRLIHALKSPQFCDVHNRD